LADKKAAKLRRRDNKQARERDKVERSGESPAQKAETVRERAAVATLRDAERRSGLDGSVGGDTARDPRS
jgi:hypothetical protein